MTTDQLTTSGLLESYLLGGTTDTENELVAQLLAHDDTLLNRLGQLSADLEYHFVQQAVPPPPAIRDQLELDIVRQELQKRAHRDYPNFDYEESARNTTAQPNYVAVEVDNTHIRVHKNWRPAFIALFILSKIFLITSLYFYFKADSQAQEITRLKAEISQSAPK